MVRVYPVHQSRRQRSCHFFAEIYPLPSFSRASVSVLTISCLSYAGRPLPFVLQSRSRFWIVAVQAFLVPFSFGLFHRRGI
jgi:hypothetical protein